MTHIKYQQRKVKKNDNTFNFGICEYPKRVVREANHD